MLSFVDSLVAPMSLINAFIVAIGMEKKEDITTYFEDLEMIWKSIEHIIQIANLKLKLPR